MDGTVTKHKIDVDEFKKTERESTTLPELEGVFDSIMKRPAKPKERSENREPTKKEIQKLWKLKR